ncbi:transcriptional coactivator YAP1 [Trichonephila inaurata madagascariensis]|uniref:Transcriptional coactivator YAP1 n=1 Tax=Trichonephila inaurata madagascariensis TaxID=2747483 RepID=A0A8X7BZ54_9ARAC|nr:transcriptional coactivator YAP1 [Trichonephila inaurata madagascariensis]
MSQQQDLIEKKGPNQVLHIRSDSETKLEAFNAQPEKGSKSPSHSRESSSDNTNYTSGPPSHPQQQQLPSGLQINHPRAHSSPASLQQAYTKSLPTPHQHPRQRVFGAQ